MSQPKLPEKSNLTREDAINQILTSIAMEELGLSHVINAEGEKLQYVLGTIEGVTGPPEPATVKDLIALNKSIRETLGDTIHIQMLLKGKMDSALDASVKQGPTGPTGPDGMILASYETLAELKRAHEKGSQGDAYLVGREIYVWDVDSGEWVSAGNLLGPTGPTGPMGPRGSTGPAGPVGKILASYESLEKLKEAHAIGSQGDTYLAGGEIYVWDKDAAAWKSIGNLEGPQGPVGPRGPAGPAGATGATGPQGDQGNDGTDGTIKAVYGSKQALETAHPDGSNPEDFYYINPDLWVWDVDTDDWVNVGKLAGPQGVQGLQGKRGETGPIGPTGPVGTISGSYNTLQELKDAHPAGTQGETYLVAGEVYAWEKADGNWVKTGDLLGPTGPAGAAGVTGPQGAGILIKGGFNSLEDLEQEHPDGPPENAYLIDGEVFIWDAVEGWHSAGSLRGPETESHTIIPFASTIAPYTYSLNGNPSRVSLLGFGYGNEGDKLIPTADYSIVVEPNNYSFTLSKAQNNDNKQLVFSLPFNMVLKNIYITVGNWDTFSPRGKVYPYIQLFQAEAGTNNFTAIDDAVAMPEEGIGPGSTPADTMLSASNDKLNVKLKAGTRIAIGAMMRTEGVSSAENYYLYFTGGIGLVYDHNPDPTP